MLSTIKLTAAGALKFALHQELLCTNKKMFGKGGIYCVNVNVTSKIVT